MPIKLIAMDLDGTLLDGLGKLPPANAQAIEEAAARGAQLTKQLLAFARKQPLQPREIDVNALALEAPCVLSFFLAFWSSGHLMSNSRTYFCRSPPTTWLV